MHKVDPGDASAFVRYASAFSNQAFELWYLLHFDFHHTAISRSDYGDRLARRLTHGYAKNDVQIYTLLYERQATAIANAQRLLACYNPWRPENDDPSTTVHELVEQLNRHRRQ
nr:RloB family protein [Candidatus Chloroploca mongolica]